MYVKQLSIFLENTPGELAKMTQRLGQAGIDLIAISIADTAHYGILRLIVSQTDRALALLKEAGYTVRLTDVLAVRVQDQPGGLSAVLNLFAQEGLSVEYLYSLIRADKGTALIVFHLSDFEKGLALLTQQGIGTASQAEIEAL